MVFGSQLYPGVPLFLPGHLLLKVSMSCPIPFHMLALMDPAQPFYASYMIVHCPRKLSTFLSCSETFVAWAAL